VLVRLLQVLSRCLIAVELFLLGSYVASSVKGAYLYKQQEGANLKKFERKMCPVQDSIQILLFIKCILFVLVF